MKDLQHPIRTKAPRIREDSRYGIRQNRSLYRLLSSETTIVIGQFSEEVECESWDLGAVRTGRCRCSARSESPVASSARPWVGSLERIQPSLKSTQRADICGG